MIVIPCIIFIVFNTLTLLPGILLIVIRNTKIPMRQPTCSTCGYDLKGHGGESITCPECGTRIDVTHQKHVDRRYTKNELVIGIVLIAFGVLGDLSFALLILSILDII